MKVGCSEFVVPEGPAPSVVSTKRDLLVGRPESSQISSV